MAEERVTSVANVCSILAPLAHSLASSSESHILPMSVNNFRAIFTLIVFLIAGTNPLFNFSTISLMSP